MKAYSITVLGYNLQFIVTAEGPGQAKAKAAKVGKATDLYFDFTDIRVQRRPQFDTLAISATKKAVLGWWDYEGRYGVLK